MILLASDTANWRACFEQFRLQHVRHSHGLIVLGRRGEQEVWHGNKSGEGGFLHSPLLEELKSLELNLGAPGVRTLPWPCLQSPGRGPTAPERNVWLC